MNADLDRQLCEACPLLYADRHGSDPTQTLMGFGFQCEDGWFDIIRPLSATLEALIRGLPEDERHLHRAFTVKQTFGLLRFYMKYHSPMTEEMRFVIEMAERLSAFTCEHCGLEGSLRKRGAWVKTLCAEHDATWRV